MHRSARTDMYDTCMNKDCMHTVKAPFRFCYGCQPGK